MRKLIFLILRWTGLPFLLRELIQRNRVTILCYHDPAPETADRHFRILKRLYNVIPLKTYIDARRAGTLDNLPRKALAITLDDGHLGNHRLLPIIRKHGVPVTIFLCSSIVGTHRHYWWKSCADHRTIAAMKRLDDAARVETLAELGFKEEKEYAERQALSDAEIEDLRNTVDLQAHSRFHPILPRCTDERAWEEIAGSKAQLERNYGLKIYAFAYPNGDYSGREVELAQRAGYACALTIDGGYNKSDTDMFRLRRVRMHDLADVNELIVKASGLWSLFEKVLNRGIYGYVNATRSTMPRGHAPQAKIQTD